MNLMYLGCPRNAARTYHHRILSLEKNTSWYFSSHPGAHGGATLRRRIRVRQQMRGKYRMRGGSSPRSQHEGGEERRRKVRSMVLGSGSGERATDR